VKNLKHEQKYLCSQNIDIDNYEVFKEIGKGAFGVVQLANSKVDGTNVAIKIVSHGGKHEQRKNFQELRFLKYCTGQENLLQFIRATLYADGLWIVTEFIGGCSLKELQGFYEFGEYEIMYIAKNTLEGLRFLHDHMIAHRDLKNHNIMLTADGVVKIIDFGLCTDVSQGQVIHMVGSPFWMPPEMVKFEFHGLPADIWSLGILLVELANDDHMFGRNYIKTMFIAATEGFPQPFRVPDDWGKTFKHFISKCLVKNPDKRWSVKKLQQHRFIKRKGLSQNEFEDIIKIYKGYKDAQMAVEE